MNALDGVRALTFDLFGTVLDLDGSLVPPLARFFEEQGVEVDAASFWAQWRARQRIEQYQDNILMLGHSGYLTTCARALRYTLRLNQIDFDSETDAALMRLWQDLSPYPEVLESFARLAADFRLVALSNGEPDYLGHLVQNRIGWEFDAVISVAEVGAFKPHPGVYRHAALKLGLEPGQSLMVSANAFDVHGARACGYRGAYINRLGLPYEDTPPWPDVTVPSFVELADALL